MAAEIHLDPRVGWDNIGVLRRELLEPIFARLPVKSLVRFKSVSKPWRDLVSDPGFIKKHYNHISRGPESHRHDLLPWPSLGVNPRRVLLDVPNVNPIFLGCCRGLICMCFLANCRSVLWNPATRLWKTLPASDVIADFRTLGIVHGFGCNDDGDDHKLVGILYRREGHADVQVYSSKSDSWQTLWLEGNFFREEYIENYAVVKGNPHWVIRMKETKRYSLLRYDATNMSFKILDLPEMYTTEWAFVNWRGCLGGIDRVERRYDGAGGWIGVWVYDEVGKTWSLNARLEGEELGGLNWSRTVNYNWRNGKIVGECWEGSLYAYDVEEGSIRIYGNDFDTVDFGSVVYKESLACVEGMVRDMGLGMMERREDPLNRVVEGFLTYFPHDSLHVFYALRI